MTTPAEYLRRPYTRALVPDEDGTYFAEILEFPGCFAEGETPNEAMENLEVAAADWLLAAIDLEQPIPDPHKENSFSGRIALRLPKSIHRQASLYAERDGTSLNQYLLAAIACKVGADEYHNVLVSSFKEQAKPIARNIFILAQSSVQVWEDAFATASSPCYVPRDAPYAIANNYSAKLLEVSKNA